MEKLNADKADCIIEGLKIKTDHSSFGEYQRTAIVFNRLGNHRLE
jgi:hypothetical protein